MYPADPEVLPACGADLEDSAERLGNMGGRQEQFAVSFMGILDSHMMMLGREQDEEHGLVMTDQRTYEIVRQFLYGIYS